MLTEDQARALLRDAGDTITVGAEPSLLDRARRARRRRRLTALASAAAVTAVVAGGAAIGLTGSGPTPGPAAPAPTPDLVAVPSLVGLSDGQATKLVKESGLRASVVVGDSCEPTGSVIGQEPEAGAEVEPGTWVDVVLEGPAGPGACPDRGAVSPLDLKTVDRFVDFARQPSESDPPWAPVVALGLGGEVLAEVPEADLADPSVWVLEGPSAQGSGSFSPLEQIATYPGENPPDYELTNQFESRLRFVCLTEPRRPPATYLEQGHAINIQPLPSKDMSCGDWWSVDLTVNEVGQITGVFLVLGES